jgi:hypothetical protein
VPAVAVGVDQARQDGLAPGVDRLGGRVRARQVVGRPDGYHPPAVDGHGAVAQDTPLRVHRHDGPAAHQQLNCPQDPSFTTCS